MTENDNNQPVSDTAPSKAALSNATLANIDPARVARPAYDRAGVTPGILHIGPGAFHRAHQAAYYDTLLETDPGFGVVGVSMRTATLSKALAPQDGLYTLAQLDETIRYRIIGSVLAVRQVGDPALDRLACADGLKIISLTVTEKGYCLAGDGTLDLTHPDIIADLETGLGKDRQGEREGDTPAMRSAVGLVTRWLALRHAGGISPPDVISCDNLPGNGTKLRAAVLAFASASDPALGDWIAAEVRFPDTMVDAITPASDEALGARVAEAIGLADRAPVQREAFCDWVVSDAARHAEALARAGAVISDNVAGYEAAKLRMLNGAHSTLAYRGLARGHETVAGAMRDSVLRHHLDQLMRDEVAPSLTPPAGLDLDAYRAALLTRFANPAIGHHLAQIAHDGSLKVPIRLIGTLRDTLSAGRPVAGLALGIAAWMRFVRRAARDNGPLVDPLSDTLRAMGASCCDDAAADTERFLTLDQVFPPAIASDDTARAALREAYGVIMRDEQG